MGWKVERERERKRKKEKERERERGWEVTLNTAHYTAVNKAPLWLTPWHPSWMLKDAGQGRWEILSRGRRRGQWPAEPRPTGRRFPTRAASEKSPNGDR